MEEAQANPVALCPAEESTSSTRPAPLIIAYITSSTFLSGTKSKKTPLAPTEPMRSQGKFFLASIALLACVALLCPTASAEQTTGYDFELTFGSREEAEAAIPHYDRPDAGLFVNHAHGNTISVYTHLKEMADSLVKRSNQAVVQVRVLQSQIRSIFGWLFSTLPYLSPNHEY